MKEYIEFLENLIGTYKIPEYDIEVMSQKSEKLKLQQEMINTLEFELVQNKNLRIQYFIHEGCRKKSRR